MIKEGKKSDTYTLVLGAILTALVIILQFMGSFIKFGPFSVSLVLIPIVLGAATCSKAIGAWLGLVFGIVVLISGDAAVFLGVNVPGTIITVLLKGTACGYVAALAYNLVEKYNRYAAVVVAAIVCPVVNTGIFLIGCYVFFLDTIEIWAQAANLGGEIGHYMIFVLVGANFLFELGTNIILNPVIVRILNAVNRK